MRCLCFILLYLVFILKHIYAEIQFVDATSTAGIDFLHVDGRTGNKYLIETLGSGALFFDYNIDGFPDLYIVNATHIPLPSKLKEPQSAPTNKLYKNNHNGTFTDVTGKSGVGDTGYGVGCAAADINNDGYPEIYITNFGENRLYLNNGNGTFSEITEKAGVGDTRWGTGCAFLDYNLDGYIDLYVVNYMIFTTTGNQGWESQGTRIYCSPVDQMDRTRFKSESDILYRNNGDNTFTDVTTDVGITHRALGLAVAVGDYDNDGDPDLHIANDMEPDLLYQNNGDGTFINITDLTGTGYDENGIPGSGMGSGFGDYNNDGFLDLIVSNASDQHVILYHNEMGQYFKDVSFASGIGAATLPYFKWAVDFFDYNNDGLQDIFVTNGHLQDNIELFRDDTYAQIDLLLQNNYIDGKHTFSNVSTKTGLTHLTKMVGRGAAFGDYDNDGDIDILLNHSNQPAKLLRNDGGNTSNWLIVNTIGTQSNTSAIGTKIILKTGNKSLIREVHSGSSYLSQNDLRVHFGLGQNTHIDTLELHWLSGHTDKLSNLKANQILRFKEGQGIVNTLK